MLSLRKITITSTLALLLSPFTAQSAFSTPESSSTIPLYIQEHILDSKGRKMLHVHFFKSTDGLLEFSSDERQIIKNAFSYWTRILDKSFNGMTPATIRLRKGIDDNADNAAYGTNQKLLDVLSGRLSPDKITSDGSIEIGNNIYSTHLGLRSHILPVQQRKADLHSLALHEFSHGLFDPEDKDDQRFFDLNTQTFGGPNAHNINEVLETHLPGADLQKIPVDEEGYHIQLAHGLMSHHNFRNWPIPMEVGLALLQDVGWTIDRRKFFGYSLYRNGQTVLNENGYFARNLDGTAYIVGTYNQEPDGVGLHIYGSRNHVTQKADILTEGTRAVGARVDGADNTLIIPRETTIHANGSDGIGVLFAYGTGHKFLLNGEIRAEGERGIGLSFDFGANLMGSDTEERGSYWRTLSGTVASPLDNHNGPLTKDVLIKGILSGTQKALYMSRSGFVEKITITSDSRVKGDIVSEYNQKNPYGKPYLTTLIFGPEKPADNVEGQKFIYMDNIRGKNISVNFTGSYTALYGGRHHLYSATIASGATLAGNSHFTIENPLGFTNSGTLSPSSAEIETFTPEASIGTMTIDGNYRQMDTGKLVIDVSRRGKADLLHVTKEAHLDGTLEIRPERTFYPNYWRKKINFLQADEGIQGDFSQKIMTPSPTLTWNFVKNDHTYGLTSPFKKVTTEVQQPTVIEQLQHEKENISETSSSEQNLEPSSQLSSPLLQKDVTQPPRTEEQTQHITPEKVVESESAEILTASLMAPKTTKKPLESTDQKREQDQSQYTKSTSVARTQSTASVATSETLMVGRQSNAYSQYATNVNEQSVGRMLDRVVDKSDKPLQGLYEALDFSTPDGSEIRSALAQLSPVAYGGAFGASLKREQQITNTLNARPSVSLALGQWQAFALPFTAQASLKAQDMQVGFNTRVSGVILGLEHQSGSMPGLTWGFHGVVGNKAALSFATADSARGSLQAWGVGLQARYQPDLLSGPYMSAQVRMGLEQGSLTRTLTVGSYKGSQIGKWQGLTSTASVLGGHLWKVNDHLSLGPLVGLDYTVLTHSKIEEKGPTGVSLGLEKTRYHSLQSSLGIRGVVSLSQKLAVDVQTRWDRELLNTTLTQKGHFATISDSAFITKTRVAQQNALNVSGQATYQISPTVTLGAGASTQFAPSQKPNLTANLTLNVKF